MSKIKKMMAEQSSVWVDYPDIEGFSVNLKYLTRELFTWFNFVPDV